jgi:hypothetical protein
MRMKFSILLVSSAMMMIAATVTRGDFTHVASIAIEADKMVTDNLGNLYAITGNTIRKYNRQGAFQSEYTRRSVDRFNDADASDPLKILLFSQNSGELIRLDNKMALQGNTTNLFSAGMVAPVLACNSYDNGAWVWDNALNEIIRINNSGNIDQRTGNLAAITSGIPNFSMMLEKDFLLYASTPEIGIMVFDRAASYIRTIPLKQLNTFQLISGNIIYPLHNNLFSFNTKTLTETAINMPDTVFVNALIEGRTIYLQQKDTIRIYTSNQPL